eukprot:12423379-Karenia_brevis.AAC.1
MPNPPAHNATPYERGVYALFVMLLFRPHRSLDDIVNFGLADVPASCPTDNAWNLLVSEYQHWRRQLEATEKK